MVKGENAYPIATMIRIRRTGEFAMVTKKTFMMEGRRIMTYLGKIEGRGDSLYALYHDDIFFRTLI